MAQQPSEKLARAAPTTGHESGDAALSFWPQKDRADRARWDMWRMVYDCAASYTAPRWKEEKGYKMLKPC